MVTHVEVTRASALNERELWREMVRWSGGDQTTTTSRALRGLYRRSR